MGDILRTFTYPRNAFSRSATASADKTHETIQRARADALLDKDEPFNDAKTFLGVVRREGSKPIVTRLGETYETLYVRQPIEAWRWLVTRSMWRFSVPNGTAMAVNEAAKRAGLAFNFFDLVARVVWLLASLPYPSDVLFFDELLPILDDDAAWALDANDLFALILATRDGVPGEPPAHRPLLGDLEDQYCGRDYMNTVFRKAFGQSGLFELVVSGASIVGIRLGDQVPRDPILWRRLKFVLDNPVTWIEGESNA